VNEVVEAETEEKGWGSSVKTPWVRLSHTH
jgi:hypothetical protein